jgi:hypothetical protein
MCLSSDQWPGGSQIDKTQGISPGTLSSYETKKARHGVPMTPGSCEGSQTNQ